MNGTINRLFKDKGFGFIRTSEGRDYFFHMSAVQNIEFMELELGQEVEFEPNEGQKGLRAEQVFV